MKLIDWNVKYRDWDTEIKTYCVKTEYEHQAVQACYLMHPALREIIEVKIYYSREEWLSDETN